MQKRQFCVYREQGPANKKLVIDTYKVASEGDHVLTKRQEIQVYSKEHENQVIGVIIGEGEAPDKSNEKIA